MTTVNKKITKDQTKAIIHEFFKEIMKKSE